MKLHKLEFETFHACYKTRRPDTVFEEISFKQKVFLTNSTFVDLKLNFTLFLTSLKTLVLSNCLNIMHKYVFKVGKKLTKMAKKDFYVLNLILKLLCEH